VARHPWLDIEHEEFLGRFENTNPAFDSVYINKQEELLDWTNNKGEQWYKKISS